MRPFQCLDHYSYFQLLLSTAQDRQPLPSGSTQGPFTDSRSSSVPSPGPFLSLLFFSFSLLEPGSLWFSNCGTWQSPRQRRELRVLSRQPQTCGVQSSEGKAGELPLTGLSVPWHPGVTFQPLHSYITSLPPSTLPCHRCPPSPAWAPPPRWSCCREHAPAAAEDLLGSTPTQPRSLPALSAPRRAGGFPSRSGARLPGARTAAGSPLCLPAAFFLVSLSSASQIPSSCQ